MRAGGGVARLHGVCGSERDGRKSYAKPVGIGEVCLARASARWSRRIGRVTHRFYPASQLGAIPRQIEGVQFGAIQCALIPPEFFVGVDERFEVLAAPGLVDSVEHAHRLSLDLTLLKLILGLGADKGLHGVALFLNGISSVIATKAIRHVSDFKGKKIRTLASKFQIEPFNRLGATPVVMTLGDVMPACRRTQTESHLL